jgi:hypothetical protein
LRLFEQEELISSSIFKIILFAASYSYGSAIMMVCSVKVLEKNAKYQGKPISLVLGSNQGGESTSAHEPLHHNMPRTLTSGFLQAVVDAKHINNNEFRYPTVQIIGSSFADTLGWKR